MQWYPGHIARAEKLLREQLRAVDAVVEVRDICIPMATTHPEIPEWIGNKLRVLVLNRADMVSDAERSKWVAWFKRNGEEHVVLTDARSGKGVKRVAEVALLVSKSVNDKRRAKGLMPRPVRTAVIGYPNVGKSALINRLTKSKACASAPRPGVTRNLRWVRIGGDLDLLDSPGVLPPRLADQSAASRLAMANDIGEASYLASSVAAQLFDEMAGLERWSGKGGLKDVVERRFKPPRLPTACPGKIRRRRRRARHVGRRGTRGRSNPERFQKGRVGTILPRASPDGWEVTRRRDLGADAPSRIHHACTFKNTSPRRGVVYENTHPLQSRVPPPPSPKVPPHLSLSYHYLLG